MNNPHRRHTVGLIHQLDVLEDIRGFGFEEAVDLDGQQTNFCIRVNAAAQLKKMAPGAGIPCYENLGLGGIGKDGASCLPRPSASHAGCAKGTPSRELAATSLSSCCRIPRLPKTPEGLQAA